MSTGSELGARQGSSAVCLSLNNLAQLYSATGRYAQAEPIFQQAANNLRATLGERHPDYASTLSNLALVYAATKRIDEAYDLLQLWQESDNRMIGTIFSYSSEQQRMTYLWTRAKIVMHTSL